MSVDAGLHLVTSTGTTFKPDEQIEWDLPYENGGGEYPDLNNLSIGTERRNKMWESDNKHMLDANMVSQIHHSQSSPTLLQHLDHNQNSSSSETNINHFMNGLKSSETNTNHFMNGLKSSETNINHFMNGLNLNFCSKPVIQGGSFMSQKFVQGNLQSPTSNRIPSPKSQPLLSLSSEQKSQDSLQQENGVS